jgi:cyclin-dependent kinase 7
LILIKGHQKDTGKRVAIKMIKVGEFKDGLDMSAMREIKFLQEMRHKNVIELVDVFLSQTNLNLVLEYLPADLEMIIKDKSIIFSPGDIKSWLLMTLRGLHHCHRHYILHRDLKPNNLLLAPDGQLKIADFGLARQMVSPRENYTPTVVTLWYRAPELLFGARHYTTAIDVWSVGLIFAELMLRTPYLPGTSEVDQLDKTFRAFGSPTETTWPGYTSLPQHSLWKGTSYPAPTRQEQQFHFLAASDSALDLMNSMTHLDPSRRSDTEQCLLSPYFSEAPPPTKPEHLPKKAQQEPESLEKIFKEEQKRRMIEATREGRR